MVSDGGTVTFKNNDTTMHHVVLDDGRQHQRRGGADGAGSPRATCTGMAADADRAS
jgi:plastocyanin